MGTNEFLKMKGAVDLLFELNGGSKTFNELVDSIKLGPNTVLSRLRAAQRLGLAEEKLARKESGRPSITYTITAEGKKSISNLQSIQKEYKRLKEELGKIKESEKEKEARITQLLSSSKATDTKISISGNKITKSKNVKMSIENDDSSE
jgi:DNA-binding HxlR family transcriptional regulator